MARTSSSWPPRPHRTIDDSEGRDDSEKARHKDGLRQRIDAVEEVLRGSTTGTVRERMNREIANRFVVAQSWWVASELKRRHPELVLLEQHPGGGLYDCLTLARRTRSPKAEVDAAGLIYLNRAGTLHAAENSVMTWPQVFALEDPHQAVRTLERSAGMEVPRTTPAAQPGTLIFRIAALLLAALVNDRFRWDVRNEVMDMSGDVSGANGYIDGFSGAAAAAVPRPDDILGNPRYRFWAVLRDDAPVAVFDVDGRVFTEHGDLNAMQCYINNGRNLTRTMMDMFSEALH